MENIIDVSEIAIANRFKLTGLPASSYTRYSDYLRDVNAFYSLNGYCTPCTPMHIYERARIMTAAFLELTGNGFSVYFSDLFVRNFVCNPSRVHQCDDVTFFQYYYHTHAESMYGTVRKDLAAFIETSGYPEMLHGMLSEAIRGKKRIDSGFFDATHDVIARAKGEKTSFFPDRLERRLNDAIEEMSRLKRNRRLRRHFMLSSNQVFQRKKVFGRLANSMACYMECHGYTESNEEYVPSRIKCRINYLSNLIMAVQDMYGVYTNTD